MLRLVMKVWCLVYKEKNMNNENNVLEYDEVCPYSEGRAAVRKDEFGGYVDENGKLKLELPCEYGWTDFWEKIERLGISFE